MGKEMYLQGPVAKRTRSKEAQFYIQLHKDYKKKKVEEKSVRKTESVSCGGVNKGNYREKNLRKASGFGGVCSGDSERDYLDFFETDSHYGLFLSGISACAVVRTNFLKDVRSSGDGYVGDDNDVHVDCNNGNLLPENSEDGDENDSTNNCETSEDRTDNLQFETRECVTISDDENDGGCVDDLKLQINSLKKHANISDDNNDGSAGDENGCSNDHDVEVCEISDESIVDLDRGKTTKVKREVNTMKRKGESSKKKSVDKWMKREEKRQAVTKSNIPLKFTFGIDKSTPPKKSEREKEMNELWDEMDMALCNVVAENTMQVDGGCVGDSNGGVNTYQTSENDSGNLKLETNSLKKHVNISDDNNNGDAGDEKDGVNFYETSERDTGNLQREFHKGSEGNWRHDENGSSNDNDVEVCEISDESDVDLDRGKTSKVKREVNTSMKRKGEGSRKKSGDKCVKNAFNGKPAKRKHIRAPRTPDVAKIIADFTLENSKMHCEENKQATKSSIPLKFTFGIEETTPPKKSEQEKEMDELWDEMDIALCDVVAENTMQVDGAIDDELEVKLDRDALCDRGEHCFILDEEIGLICKHCVYIKTEIKYFTVPFDENPFGRSGRRGSFTVENNTLENFHCPDLTYNSGSTRDPNFLEQGTVWDIIPGIDDGMHQHQKEGFEFLWRNIAGDILMKKLKEDSDGGSGCVISHAPGTGKTRLTIAFLQSYLKKYPLCRALIIAPCGMLPTWEAEFHKWKIEVPFHNLNSAELFGKENISALKLVSKGNSVKKEKLTRMVKLFSWAKGGSILGMSYRLFQELIGAVTNTNHKEDDAEKIRKILLEHTGLMVLDEGHTARNDDSLIWQALSKVRTEKRIILSGTPFQNNFDELYNILWLVRPKFAQKIPYISHKVSKRIGSRKNEAREVWGSLTEKISREKDDRLKDQTLAQLKKVIGPFVHIHKGNVLQEKLPGLRDSLIVLEPCQLQKNLLVNAEKMDHSCFGKEHMISVLSVHPSLLLDISFDLEKFGQNFDGLERSLGRLRSNPEVGIKTKFLMAFIRLCQAVNERVLIFSQFIHPLGFIIEQLKSRFRWSEGREILSIHGKVDVDKRQQMIKDFNNPKSEAKVLLASTRACSEGINLVGASRLVLLDVVWNPSVERQAISRAYRLGQERVVHIYHLITSGTMEEEKYCRQAEKDRLSELLFCAEDKADDLQKTPSNLPDGKRDKILKRMIDDEKLKSMFKKIIDQPKCANLIKSFGFPEL